MSEAKTIKYVVVRFYNGELPHIMGWCWTLADARALVRMHYADDSEVVIWRLKDVPK